MTTPFSIRALDSAGDWQFGNNLQSLLYGGRAIEENLQTSLYCFRYDAFWATTFGVDWLHLLGAKSPQAEQQILIQSRAIIIQAYGITRILSVDLVVNRMSRGLSLQYNLNTIYTQNLVGSILP
jgi:hypothetical protein